MGPFDATIYLFRVRVGLLHITYVHDQWNFGPQRMRKGKQEPCIVINHEFIKQC